MRPTILFKLGSFVPLPYLVNALQERGDVYFDQQLNEAQRSQIYSQVQIVIASGSTKFTDEDFDSMPNLKGITCYSVGYDKIDVQAAIKRNIFVTHTPEVLNDDVANTAMLLTLNCTRQAYAAQRFIENNEWSKDNNFPLTTSISNKRMGIVGLGRIGKEIATRASAFKMEIGYYGRHKQEVSYRYFDNLIDLASWSDVLMLILPATSENKHIINAQVLEALGPQGFLINVARGSVLDTEALIQALENKTIQGAALDVFETEPVVDDRLKNKDNVILSPHFASATQETRKAMADLVVKNVDCILNGQKVITPVIGTRQE